MSTRSGLPLLERPTRLVTDRQTSASLVPALSPEIGTTLGNGKHFLQQQHSSHYGGLTFYVAALGPSQLLNPDSDLFHEATEHLLFSAGETSFAPRSLELASLCAALIFNTDKSHF